MSEVSGINGMHAAPAVSRRTPVTDQDRTDAGYGAPQDAVEISDIGALLATLRELPDVRVDRVAQISAEIEAGTYETPERLEETVNRLLEELT